MASFGSRRGFARLPNDEAGWPKEEIPDGSPPVPPMEGRARASHAPERMAMLAALRHAIGRIEGAPPPIVETPGGPAALGLLPLGAPRFDAALGGGLPRRGLLEARTRAARDSGAAIGFALALAIGFGASPERPLLWIASAEAWRETGFPCREGLLHFGLDPGALVLLRTRTDVDAAWAGEEAARSGAPALTVVEARGNPAVFALEGSRRLHTRAKDAGVPILLVRHGGEAETGAAPLRLLVAPGRAAPVAGLETLPLLGRPRFALHLEKARGLRSRTLCLEWDPHERRFHDIDAEPGIPRRPADAPFHRPDPARAPGAVVALRREGGRPGGPRAPWH
ncbi:hypothetical protein [Aureimonas sp. ME7]|uniref:ImuA family protein n=1 Tax=Aureimonas sp. ME7 TaxID=2744252 RepID=UPI0015F676F6|nr:hypothetical protein [Aureimonas sp. ME7]